MATGREGRAERLNERLRGAGRVNVDDDTFDLGLAGLGQPAPGSPAKRNTPDSSNKRRKLDSGAAAKVSTEEQGAAPAAAPRRSQPRDLYELPVTSKDSDEQTAAAQQRTRSVNRGAPTTVARKSTASPATAVRRSTRSPATRSSLSLARTEAGDDVLTLAGPSSVRSSRRSRQSGSIIEEVEESPTDAPGGGRRISMPLSSAVASSARLQSALDSEDPAPASSSPLARKARKSDVTGVIARRRSPRHRVSNAPTDDDVDELSPSRPRDKAATNHSSRANRRKANDVDDIEAVSVSPDQSEAREGEAEEINETEAAKALGRKRPRRSIVRDASPQLGSDDQVREEASVAPKRKRGRPSNSPATQKQPVHKPKQKQRRHSATTGRTKAKAPPRRRRRKSDEPGDSNRTVEVTVQRFVQKRMRRAGDEADPLHIDLPFANRSGESSVDVFAQVCDEVISATANQFQEHIDTAGDRARQKEYRIKKRAVEAYQEVLHARMLEHTIHLNHWYSLRKRLRYVQKEKLSLREEIIRLRSEREQVALRMDAVRLKHKADTEESDYLLNISSTMRDIDRTVARGREAPRLSRKEEKEAELANLELVVAQIANQVSPSSASGGLLKDMQDFNAFLERAAVALEAK